MIKLQNPNTREFLWVNPNKIVFMKQRFWRGRANKEGSTLQMIVGEKLIDIDAMESPEEIIKLCKGVENAQ